MASAEHAFFMNNRLVQYSLRQSGCGAGLHIRDGLAVGLTPDFCVVPSYLEQQLVAEEQCGCADRRCDCGCRRDREINRASRSGDRLLHLRHWLDKLRPRIISISVVRAGWRSAMLLRTVTPPGPRAAWQKSEQLRQRGESPRGEGGLRGAPYVLRR